MDPYVVGNAGSRGGGGYLVGGNGLVIVLHEELQKALAGVALGKIRLQSNALLRILQSTTQLKTSIRDINSTWDPFGIEFAFTFPTASVEVMLNGTCKEIHNSGIGDQFALCCVLASYACA